MTLTGATPVQYSRGGFAENRKYQATGNGPRFVRRVSIIRRPITVRPVPPAVRYARVREGGLRRKTETIPGALDGRLDGDYRALTRFKNSVCRGRGRNRNARPSPGPRDRAGRNSAAAGSESRNARNTALRVHVTRGQKQCFWNPEVHGLLARRARSPVDFRRKSMDFRIKSNGLSQIQKSSQYARDTPARTQKRDWTF